MKVSWGVGRGEGVASTAGRQANMSFTPDLYPIPHIHKLSPVSRVVIAEHHSPRHIRQATRLEAHARPAQAEVSNDYNTYGS